MPDFSDIPDEAVTASSEAVYRHRLNYEDRDADGRVACVCGQWREPGDMSVDEDDWGHHVASAVLAAALPALTADLVAEIQQKDLDLEEFRTGVLRVHVDAATLEGTP